MLVVVAGAVVVAVVVHREGLASRNARAAVVDGLVPLVLAFAISILAFVISTLVIALVFTIAFTLALMLALTFSFINSLVFIFTSPDGMNEENKTEQ